MSHSQINVGIDTSLHQLDVGVRPTGEFNSFPNDKDGIKLAIKWIKSVSPDRVLIESTGRLETPFVVGAAKAGLPVILCNAIAIHHFAKGSGQLAKTDRIDAFTIAHYGERMEPDVIPIKSDSLRLISDLLTVRSQLNTQSTMLKNQIKRMPNCAQKHLSKVLKSVRNEISLVEKRLDRAVARVPEFKEKVDLLTSSHSVGKVLAYTLLSELPELGTMNRKQVAALAGIAPMNRDSGKKNGHRFIRGGRHKVRTALYMSMMSAIQHHPKFKHKYQQMVIAGKPKRIAIIACARKQLVILNTMMKNGTHWDPSMA